MGIKAVTFDLGGTLVGMNRALEYEPLPGAEELIAHLRERKAKVPKVPLYTCIITNGSREEAHRLLKTFGWEDAFDSVVAASERHAKPMASMMDEALGGYSRVYSGNPPLRREVVHVGDSDVDQELAATSNTRFLGIGDKFPKPLAPEQQCHSLHDVKQRLSVLARDTDIERG